MSDSDWFSRRDRSRGSGRRVDISAFDDQLTKWYVDEDLSIRHTYRRVKRELLDEHEWTTELAVRYRLQELGHKDPRGRFDDLEDRLLGLDPEDVGLSPLRHSDRSQSAALAADGGRRTVESAAPGGDRTDR